METDMFYKLVGDMRARQKEFFRTHNANVLNASKELEKLVDEELKKYEDEKYGGKLF